MFYRRSNLEHAAASLSNILFGCLLVVLLILVVLAAYLPPVTVAAIHPMTVVLIGVYVGGLRLIRRNGSQPMWEAVRTRDTRLDQPGEEDNDGRRTRSVWAEFAVIATAVSIGGAAVALAAEGIIEATGLTAGFVGAILLGIVNAIPETVTAITAVRRGALTLAIGAILGGNAWDALNVAIGDTFYRGGSLYHQAGPDELFLTLTSALMTTIVVAGLLVRQSRGPGRVGFEGAALIAIYAALVAVLGV